MNDVREAAKRAGVYVGTWAPGDGATRYAFFADGTVTAAGEWVADFHSGHELYSALGRKDALTWLAGFKAGKGA